MSRKEPSLPFQPHSDKRLMVHVREVLEFFDTKPSGSETHPNSVVAVMGEDLGAALFCRHLSGSGLGAARPLLRSPTPGTKTGNRLDRWFWTNWVDGRQTIFQAEIKNWSAQAIGGKALALDAPEDVQNNYRKGRWANQWDSKTGCFRHNNVGKVLNRMKLPAGVPPDVHVEPLVIYWYAIHPEGANEPLFTYPAPAGSGFDKIWFFSMSTYLRSVTEEMLELDMPNAVARIDWLNKLVALCGGTGPLWVSLTPT